MAHPRLARSDSHGRSLRSSARLPDRRPVGALALAAALVLALGGSGCRAPSDSPSDAKQDAEPASTPITVADGRPPNVLFVLVDTLRADRLSLYGYSRPTSPRLEQFARERGVVFRSAWSNAGCTYPSVNSLFTGLWPQRVLEEFPKIGMAIPAALPTMAEMFAGSGYATAAVSASEVVRKTPGKLNPDGGFDRGFSSFDERCGGRWAGCVNQRAIDKLDQLTEPFFLYLHYLDPHASYSPPQGAPRAYSRATRAAASPWARKGFARTIERVLLAPGGPGIEPDDARHLSDLYDDEVAYFDSRFGALIAELERRALFERTIVVFAADHGEELLDHGHWGHCADLAYQTVVGTPLVIAAPGFAPGARDAPVSNVDLLPTLAELAGLPIDRARLDGRSLAPLLRGRPDSGDDRMVFAAEGSARVAVAGDLMLRLNLRDGGIELDARLGELVRDEAAETRLRRALFEWIRRVDRGNSESVRRADEVREQLTALGYL